jgi:hypothetical protein
VREHPKKLVIITTGGRKDNGYLLLWKRSFETLPDETFKNQEAFRFDF